MIEPIKKAKTTQSEPDAVETAQEMAAAIISAAKDEALRIMGDALKSGAMTFAAGPNAPAPTKAESAQPNVRPRRIEITLSEGKEINRGGQWFGVNGASFLIKPGRKMNVPEGMKDVLDNAIEGYPVQDPDTLQVVEWRQRLKYPYIFHGYVDEKPTA